MIGIVSRRKSVTKFDNRLYVFKTGYRFETGLPLNNLIVVHIFREFTEHIIGVQILTSQTSNNDNGSLCNISHITPSSEWNWLCLIKCTSQNNSKCPRCRLITHRTIGTYRPIAGKQCIGHWVVEQLFVGSLRCL